MGCLGEKADIAAAEWEGEGWKPWPLSMTLRPGNALNRIQTTCITNDIRVTMD